MTPTNHLLFPGPPPTPIVGPMGNAIQFSRDVVGHADKLVRGYGPLVSIVGGQLRDQPRLARWVLVANAELYREIVTRPDDFFKPPLNKQLSPSGTNLTERERAFKRWGAGLFNLNGEEHKEHRRIMMPGLHKSRVEGYCADIAAITEAELQTWRPGSVRDIREDMVFLTLRIVARCLLGETVTERGDGSIGDLIQQALRLVLRPSVFLVPVDRPGFPYRHLLDVVYQADQKARRIVEARRSGGGTGNDILSMLLRAQHADGSPLSDEHIIEHTGVMFIAGHETSSNAMMWTLLLLSQHPKIAAELLDELEGRLHGAAPTAEDLAALPFLDAVVRESMRLMPPVPMNARVIARDTELRGHALPAGTQLLVSLFHTHRSPEVYDRPTVFDPRRWETCKPATYEYTPFGTGPRTCIGAPFAMTELKIVLAMLVQRFRLELLPGTRVDRSATITLSVKGGLPMAVCSQDHQFHRGVGSVRGNIREMIELPA